MIQCSAIKREDINEVWDTVAPFFEQAVKYARGELFLEDIHNSLSTGDYLLLIVHEGTDVLAALTLNMHNGRHKKLCTITFAGGTRLDEWKDTTLKVIEQVAKEQGADMLCIKGRRGWVRKLQQDGFKEYSMTIGKELK